MSKSDIQFQLDLSEGLDMKGSGQMNPKSMNGSKNGHISNGSNGNNNALTSESTTNNGEKINRRRSNSQSQVIITPNITREKEEPKKKQFQYFVTLTSLNETFIQKNFSVPYYPDTRKLGRPTGTKIKPDVTNGFFDSRVLSRNHAAMYIDQTGKLMLKDLGSSNGTYLNDEKLDNEPVEVKVGDSISFGFNIQAGMNHKQINAKVESIDIMNNLVKTEEEILNSKGKPLDSTEFKHYKFIQELYNKISNQNSISPKNSNQDNVSFESAMFSDINPEIEDNLLGLYTKANNGIFKNSGTSTSSKLEQSINLLINIFTKVKQQHNSLISVEEFLEFYKSKSDELNQSVIQNEINSRLNEFNGQINNEKLLNEKLTNDFEFFKEKSYKKSKLLEEKLYKLKDEKSTLNKRIAELEQALILKDEEMTLLYNQKEEALESIKILKEEQSAKELNGIQLLENESDKQELQQKNEQDKISEIIEELASPNFVPHMTNKSLIDENLRQMEQHKQESGILYKEKGEVKEEDQNDREVEVKDTSIESITLREIHEISNESGSDLEPSISPDEINETEMNNLKQLDEDNDLRYSNNGVFLGLFAVLIGIIIHKYVA
ncbi:hypothetical protein CLIB1444_01S01222 [[Candida] jaroonii]|uniref:Uncharacterized protein n=1 Tax=[Candida] jaroonii TaxID=467808 RepID=A0ACA9Y103_9ASCO|nr:hypothetical protein CLIB1444_01S01222 [[Candida] jaroonii]